MEELFFDDLREKNKQIGFRISEYEREQLDIFCKRERLTITSFFRFAMRVVISQNFKKKVDECNAMGYNPK